MHIARVETLLDYAIRAGTVAVDTRCTLQVAIVLYRDRKWSSGKVIFILDSRTFRTAESGKQRRSFTLVELGKTRFRSRCN